MRFLVGQFLATDRSQVNKNEHVVDVFVLNIQLLHGS